MYAKEFRIKIFFVGNIGVVMLEIFGNRVAWEGPVRLGNIWKLGLARLG